MQKKNNSKAIRALISSEKDILNYLRKVVKTHSFNYRTFGVAVEPYISEVLIKNFKKAGLIKTKKDYFLAPNKNYFPDFELKTSLLLAIEYKSGNRVKKSKERWAECKNSNNDMGTLNVWSDKIKKFGGKNIYYVFAIYKFDDQAKKILDVEIAPFYKFIGLNSAGLLRYREKDGNLRPKDFYQKAPVKSLKEFNQLLKETIIYRSKRIIKKHQAILKSCGVNVKLSWD